MFNIGILTNFNDQLIPFLLKEIHKLKNIKFYLIISKTKKDNNKSLKIFKERTGNYFFKHNLDLYSPNIILETYIVESNNSKKFDKIIKDKNIKFLYNLSTANKINIQTIKKVKGIINIHQGILPNYRGCTCPEWTLFNNDPLGVTAHFMDKEYDSGPIIIKKYLKFKKTDIKEYKDIRIRLYLLTLKLAKTIFKQITNKKIKVYKQNKYKAKYHNVISNNYLSIIKKKIKNKKYIFHKKNLIN